MASPLEKVDVLMVDDVTPYELMKLRLLNASHQSLCYFAYLAGYRLVHDAAGDPLFAEFLRAYMDTEATPTLKPVPGIDLPDYKSTLIERFANPGVKDTIARAVLRLIGPHPEVAAPGHQGEPENRCTRASLGRDGRQLGAIARRHRRAGRADGILSRISSPNTLVPLAKSQRENPTAFIENTAVFGDLASDPRFVEGVRVGTGFAASKRCARDTGDTASEGTAP